MKRTFVAPLLGLLLLAPIVSRAEEGAARPLFKTGARGTVGSGGYLGRDAYLQFGDVWRLKGSYSDYRFDGSTGTTRTAALRGNYQGENLSLGLNGSLTPRNDNYANRSFGVDGAWTFFLNDVNSSEDEGELTEFELGAWWSQTRHSQIVPATATQPNARTVIINQHDLGVNASITGEDVTVSVDGTRTLYDQNFANLPTAIKKIPRLGETLSLVNSFPDKSASVRVKYGRWRACVPFVSVAASRYHVQPQPNTLIGGAGVSLHYEGLGADLSYELVRQKGANDTKYFSFGGSWRF
jgi:hypothetical protein